MLKLDCMINTGSKRIIIVVRLQATFAKENMADENRTFPTEINSQEFHLFRPNFISL